jgi:hypothetical protein
MLAAGDERPTDRFSGGAQFYANRIFDEASASC